MRHQSETHLVYDWVNHQYATDIFNSLPFQECGIEQSPYRQPEKLFPRQDQVGWCIGPTHLMERIHQLLPNVQFCASTLVQEALALSLPKADLPYLGFKSYYHYLKAKYIRKRDLLSTALEQAGFAVPDYNRTASGGFFLFARIGKELAKQIPQELTNVQNDSAPGGIARQDWALCQWLIEEKGILCIPSSPFFSLERSTEGASDEFIRIAFCKTDETIQEAARAFGLVLDLSKSTLDGIPLISESEM